jgi:hypothetical protein
MAGSPSGGSSIQVGGAGGESGDAGASGMPPMPPAGEQCAECGAGVHGVEIKKFKVKKEIPRGGDPVMIEFTATEAGRFPIVCSEYCGNGHDDMKGALIVKARDSHAP